MNTSGRSASISFPVMGMTCRSCVKRVEATLFKNEGVTGAEVNLSRREATVHFDDAVVDSDVLMQSIREAGYMVPERNASDRSGSKATGGAAGEKASGWMPILIGFAAALGVFGFYLGLLTLTSNWYFARVQFSDYIWWITALAFGLGIQGSLFTHMRIRLRRDAMKGAKSSLAASGGMSAVSMAVCCAHFLPTLGLPFLTAAAAGLARYQTLFFAAGIISNFFGIGFMLRMMVKNGITVPGIFLGRGVFGVRKS